AAMNGKQQAYNNLLFDGNRALIAVDYAGLEILDMRRPLRPLQLGWWNPWAAHTLRNLWINSPGHTNQLAFDPDSQHVFLSAGDSELLVVNVSVPNTPKLTAQYGTPGNGRGTWGLAITPDLVLLTYIKTFVPFRGTWSGIRAVRRMSTDATER
ncbi:MAG: hypothetical protein KDA89_11010, partial [Planctomycetaceae bacterium]|nr:hypothetical protein [Planctomycetaceae bacterium]